MLFLEYCFGGEFALSKWFWVKINSVFLLQLFKIRRILLTDLNTELFSRITIELPHIHLSLFLFPGFNGTVCVIV